MLTWHKLCSPVLLQPVYCNAPSFDGCAHQSLPWVWQEARLQQQSEEVKQQLQEAQHSAAAAELLHASAVARHLKTLEAKEVQPHPFPLPPPQALTPSQLSCTPTHLTNQASQSHTVCLTISYSDSCSGLQSLQFTQWPSML